MPNELTVNLQIDASPECLKRLCDGLAAAVKPDGGYRAATLEDPDIGDGGDQMVQVEWWIPQHGCDSLENTLDAIKGRLLVAVTDWWATALAPATPPAPETPAEALAARPLLEQVARLGDCIGANTVGQIMAISSRAAAWLEENPPGQPVAIEPRGCPTPGACSCVEPAPAAPKPGEVGELVEWLWSMRELAGEHNPEERRRYARAATLLQQFSAPAPAVVPVAVAERPWEREGWCDEQGRCWFLSSRFLTWALESPPVALTRSVGRFHSLPAHAIPLPQAGEAPHV